MNAGTLHDIIAKVCPIGGVVIGVVDDKSTWAIRYSETASDHQRASAQAIIDAYDPKAETVPASVKMWQAKAAMALVGKLDAANAAIAASKSVPLQLAWEYATDISRTSVSVSAIGKVLGMSDADIDALFISADKIAV